MKANRDWLDTLAPTKGARVHAIDTLFRERSKIVRATQFDHWIAPPTGGGQAGHIAFTVARSLSELQPDECAALRCAMHLINLTDATFEPYRSWCAALLWGHGKGQIIGSVVFEGLERHDPIGQYMAKNGLTPAGAIARVFGHLTEVANRPSDPNPESKPYNDMAMAFRDLLMTSGWSGLGSSAASSPKTTIQPAPPAPTNRTSRPEEAPMPSTYPFAAGGAAQSAQPTTLGGLMGNSPGFLQSSAVPQTRFATKGPHAIYLGAFDDGTWLSYSDSGALVTIAPPGSGKSQCHVIPNLLQWKAPAVVLDVKGEIYATTSKWRAANVGPVFRFSPTDTARSHHYNPLALVSDDSDKVWQEARFLADMFIVPSTGSNKGDSFWDTSAKAVVTAAIAYICYVLPPERRKMSELLDVIHGGESLQKMIKGLRAAVDVAPMLRASTSLAEMEPQTRANILATVQTSFQAWEDVPIERVTDRCDWSPLDLRKGSPGAHPTIYICLRPHEVEAYISILRVFIAQHIRLLTSTEMTQLDRTKILPILFLLDELPRLGKMPPVASAIEIGASYGLRVWMFAQSLGQLQEAYPNADGMISSCAVRVYLNPSGADGLAEKLSKELGNVTNLADGSQQPLVPPHELAGPKWADWQLVLASGTRPARIRKKEAWRNDELQARIGAL